MLLVPGVILEEPCLRPPPPPPRFSPAAAVSVITLWQASPDSRPTKQIRSCGPVAGLSPDFLHHVCAPLPRSLTHWHPTAHPQVLCERQGLRLPVGECGYSADRFAEGPCAPGQTWLCMCVGQR